MRVFARKKSGDGAGYDLPRFTGVFKGGCTFPLLVFDGECVVILW
jgi:hypothetical protein